MSDPRGLKEDPPDTGDARPAGIRGADIRGADARSTDLPSGRGVPGWIADSLHFCPNCGNPLTLGPIDGEDRDRLACPSCGHIAYVNPRLVVTTLPITDAGQVILIRRGLEPGLDSWAQPGGFLEIDETVAEGAARETLEETGLVVEPTEVIGLYTRLEAAVVVIVFEARVVGGEARTSREALEVQAFDPEAIPWAGIAFKTSYFAIADWLTLRHPELTAPPPTASSR